VNTIQLLHKASQVVDELARLGPSTPAELAKAVSEPRSTIYRITAGLGQAELVRSDSDGKLELGVGILRLGDAAVDALVDRAELHEQLTWVRSQLGVGAFFCVLRENGTLCLDQVHGAEVDLFPLAPGGMLPLHAGAPSLALLAFAPPQVRAAVLENAPFDRLASATPLTAGDLREKLAQTAARGWSVEHSTVIEGVASLGVPVRHRDGSVLGVIAVAGLRESVLSQESVASGTLRTAAEAIAAAMDRPDPAPEAPGAPGPPPPDRNGARQPAAITKASALMDALARERIATSGRLTELLGEPVTSVYRMLATLAEAGWVEQIGHRGAYRVGSKMLSLAGGLTRRLDLRRAGRPVLQQIHQATGETAFLCIRRGARAVCIERLDGIRVSSRVLQLGESLPLHVGAAPRALLAFEARRAWEEYAAIMANGNEPWRDVRSRSEFYADLEEIRAQGYVRSDNNVTSGIAAIGAPIFDHRGDVVASLSVSGLRDGVLAPAGDHPSVTELVLQGAQGLSRYLGAPQQVPGCPGPGSHAPDVSKVIV
jgi:DNA-binding IclR family transcriptional regulator